MLLRLVMILALLAAPAAAEEVLLKFQRNYQGKELAFLHTYCFMILSVNEYFWSGDKKLSQLEVAFYDLNDDGEDEMLVILPFGGTAGEDLVVFQRREGQWALIGETLIKGIWVADERVAGYLTLFSEDVGLRWDPARNSYWSFCVSSVCEEEQG